MRNIVFLSSANYVDSFSVKKHGLYVPKRPFNSFIIPPHKSSHSVHGEWEGGGGSCSLNLSLFHYFDNCAGKSRAGKSPSRKKWNRINSGSKCSSNPSNNTITTHSTTHVIPHEDLLTISMAPESKRPTVKDMGLKDTSLPEEAPVGNDATPLSSSEGVDVATDDRVREDASRGSPREPSKEPPRRPSPREPPREPSPREPSPREPPREPPGEECESDFISLEARELTSQILLEAQLTASVSNGDLYHDATPIVREDTPRGPPRGPSPRGPPRGPSPRGPPREPSPRGPPRGPPREPSREPPREPPREPSPRELSSREPPREPPGGECESDFISLEARELTSQILLEAQLTASASNGDLYHDATPIEHSDDPVSDPHLDTTASEGNIMETTTYTVNTTMSTKSSTIIIDMSSLTAGGEESDY